MTTQALLIGAQTFGLAGVHSDLDDVEELLERWQARVQRLDEQATRDNILDAWRRLIHDCGPTDAALVYYSGHGAWALNPRYDPDAAADARQPQRYQFIVPVDMDQSSPTDFRGITSVELSRLLFELTERTDNVTVIMDCCHSATMSRDTRLRPRALPGTWKRGVRAHLERLRSQGVDLRRPFMESNPKAVRLSAAAAHQSAFEIVEGESRGLFTLALGRALRAAGDQRLSWDTLLHQVRQEVTHRAAHQRPELAGPGARLLLSTERVEHTGVLQLDVDGTQPILAGGRLHGVHVGDRYGLMAAGAAAWDPAAAIARATVTATEPTLSRIDVDLGLHSRVPTSGLAFPLSRANPGAAVRLQGDPTQVQRLAQRVAAEPLLRLAQPGEEVLATVDLEPHQLTLFDHSGKLWLVPLQDVDQDARLDRAGDDLVRLARARAVAGLELDPADTPLPHQLRLSWGVEQAGQATELDPHGETLHGLPAPAAGDRVWFRIHNDSTTQTVFVTLVDVGPTGNVAVITGGTDGGVRMEPSTEHLVAMGQDPLLGFPMHWPPGAPQQDPREETVIAIICDRAQSFRSLQQPGSTRAVGTSRGAAAARYDIQRLTFLLAHGPATTG